MTIQRTSVLILGAGEFGAATAVSLLETGNYTVTVLDKAPVLPAEDAASTDLNKVVRFDYSDPDYADLAWEAIRRWNQEEWKGIYHETGVVLIGTERPDAYGEYMQKSLANVSQKTDIEVLNTNEGFQRRVDPAGRGVVGPQEDRFGYFNPKGGWAHASGAVEHLYGKLLKLGGQLVAGVEITELIVENGDVVGARSVDGREWGADKTIVAMGSWSGSFLKDLLPPGLMVATGQAVGGVQLREEERERYKDVRVIMSRDGSGFYMFPPNKDGMVKFATHAGGYVPPEGKPRTVLSPGARQYNEEHGLGWIPENAAAILKAKVSEYYPELGKKPFAFTRMCYYSDVVDANWLIDYHPKHPSLLIASGGSGHAFKFLTIIGDLIRQRLEGTLNKGYTAKWSLRPRTYVDPARALATREELRLEKLAKLSELQSC